MTTEVLATIILSVCPNALDVSLCHEELLNCTVSRDGEIREEQVSECVNEYVRSQYDRDSREYTTNKK